MASNPFASNSAAGNEQQPKQQKMDVHRQMMENKLRGEEGKSSNAYVSPSDAIMSPASQKLSGFKQRQMNKSNPVKPRTLFAKTATTTREKDLGPEEQEQDAAKTESS